MGRSIIIVIALAAVLGGGWAWYVNQKPAELPSGLPRLDSSVPKSGGPETIPVSDVGPPKLIPTTRPPGPEAAPALIANDAASSPRHLEGTVRDKESGEPIPNATVSLVRNDYRAPSADAGRVVIVAQFDEVVLRQTATGDDGAYSFAEQAEETRMQIRATAPGYIQQDKDGVQVGRRADFSLIAGAEVSGRVVDAVTKAPVVGATVRGFYRTPGAVRNVHEAFRWAELQRTNEKGEFRFPGVPSKPDVKFLIWHDDYEEFSADRGVGLRDKNEFVFEVKRGLVLAGIVTDSLTKKPIANVEVSATNHFVPQHRVKSDAAGRFVVRGAARGPLRFSFACKGYTEAALAGQFDDSKSWSEGHDDRLLSVAMEPAGRISGRVVDLAGVPLDNAKVFVARNSVLTWPVRGTVEAVTDAQGRFEVGDIGAGKEHRVAASKDGFVIGHSETVVVKAAELFEGVTVKLGRGASIRGRVTDEVGEPVTGVDVRAEKPPFSGVWFGPGQTLGQAGPVSTVTDDQGRYELAGLWPGQYTFTVTHPQHVPLNQQVVRVPTEEIVVDRDFSMKIGRYLAGRVTFQDGRPGIGAQVVAQVSFSDEIAGRAAVDSDGFYRIDGLVKGTYRVQARHGQDTSRALWQVSSDSDNVNFVLEEAGALAGLVTDGRGEPISSFTVALISESVAAESGGAAKAGEHMGGTTRSFDESSGQFKLDGIDPGRYTVSIASPLHVGLRQSQVTIGSGAVTDLGTIVLPTGARVRGRISDSRGDPVRDAQVVLTNLTLQEQMMRERQGGGERSEETPRFAPTEQSSWSARVDQSGNYTLGGLSPGQYSLRVTSSDYVPPPESQFVVAADGEYEQNATLRVACRISVTVKDDLNQPLAAVMALVHEAASDARVRLPKMNRSDARGILEVEGVPPGSYRIKLQRTGYVITEIEVKQIREGEHQTYQATMNRL